MPYNTKKLKRDKDNIIVPQYWNEDIDDYEILTGSDGSFRAKAPIDIVEEPFSSSGNLTKEFSKEISGVAISNDGDANLTFTIHGKTHTLKAGEVYEGKFKPFTTMTVNSTVPWRAEALRSYSGIVEPVDTTAPNNATNLLASNITETSLTLTWTASDSSDTTGYDIYRGTNLVTTVTDTSYNATGLTASTQYTFNVKAKDAANNIASGVAITITTANMIDVTPPINVTNLVTSNVAETSVTLSWSVSSSSDVASYEVYQGSTLLSTVTGTIYNVTGLTNSTLYTFTIKAKDASNNIATGVSVSATTLTPADVTAPNNIANLTTSSITATSLTLSWSASTSGDVASYDIYDGITLLGNVATTNYSATGLTEKTQYTFTVKAKDSSGNVASGTSITVTTADITAPANVTNLTTANVAQTTLTLNWTASTSSDIASYDVFNGTTLLANVTTTTYGVTGLTASTQYTFTVKAKDASNNIASGASVTVTTSVSLDTTNPEPVTALTAGTPTSDSIPVSWTLSTSGDVANYEVAYSSNGGTTYTVSSAVVNSSSTTYTVTGLAASTSYSIRVVAIDGSGNRSTGQVVTVSTTAATTYVTGGLTTYYDFSKYTTTPATIDDDSGSGNTGTLVGYDGTTYNGITNGELRANNGGYITSSHIMNSYAFTVEMLVRIFKRPGGVLSTGYRYFDSTTSSGSGNGVGFAYNTSAHSTTPNTLLLVGSLSQPSFTTSNVGEYMDNTYKHLVITWDSGVQKLYVDGVLHSTSNQTSTNLSASTRTLQFFRHSGNSLPHGCKLIRFYNRSLTNQEVTQNFNALPSVTSDTTPPSEATNFRSTITGSTSINLAWDASISSDIYGYVLYSNGSKIAVATGASYIMGGLSPSTTYNLTLKAIDQYHNESSGVSISITTNA